MFKITKTYYLLNNTCKKSQQLSQTMIMIIIVRM